MVETGKGLLKSDGTEEEKKRADVVAKGQTQDLYRHDDDDDDDDE